MKTPSLPHTPYSGLIARTAIQCVCPDTGKTGSFLFSGESHRNKGSRVTPVFNDLTALYQFLNFNDWIPANINYPTGAYIFTPGFTKDAASLALNNSDTPSL